MRLEGNTVFITGGSSGIGRGLAEALHRRGNKVVIGGRRREHLEGVLRANPGMDAVQIDIADAASIDRAVVELTAAYPALNVLINNAGIPSFDDVASPGEDDRLVATVATNLLGPIRTTSALIDHLKSRDDAVVAYTTSTMAFVPLAMAAVYSATKAALHSYVLSQRFMLKDSGVRVIEIAPPWVRTGFMDGGSDQAMPLDAFLDEAVTILGTDADEVVVEGGRAFRENPGPGEHAYVNRFNEQAKAMVAGHS